MKPVNQRAISLLFSGLVGACNYQPATPTAIVSSVPPATTPVPGWVAYRVVGLVVDGEVVPVAGADLTFSGSAASRTTVTDAIGACAMTIELRQRRDRNRKPRDTTQQLSPHELLYHASELSDVDVS